MSKFLEFEEIDGVGTVGVFNKKKKAKLGEIGFYVLWKQYVFIPAPNSIFSDTCLEDIIKVIEEKNEQKFRRNYE